MHFRLQTTESKIPWGESVRFALRSIAAEKLNASLTTLAVVIGSAAIVLVIAIGSSGRLYIVSLIEGIGRLATSRPSVRQSRRSERLLAHMMCRWTYASVVRRWSRA
jgi:hypothetical protein